MTSSFICKQCGEEHTDLPALLSDKPAQYWTIPEEKRTAEILLTTDSCVISDQFFFILGLLEIPILDSDQTLTWGVWVSLSESNFKIWEDHYDLEKRSFIGPFFGWLNTSLPTYETTLNLKTNVHIRDDFQRPLICLQETDHELYRQHQQGISMDKALEILHGLNIF